MVCLGSLYLHVHTYTWSRERYVVHSLAWDALFCSIPASCKLVLVLLLLLWMCSQSSSKGCCRCTAGCNHSME